MGDPFLTVSLITFTSDEPAIARYDTIKEGFEVNNLPVSELNSADENSLDEVSALIDSDGVGRITVFRQNNRIISVNIGPTIGDSPWTVGDIQMIGKSIVERASN